MPSTVIAKSQRQAPKPSKPDPRVEGTKFPLTLETLFTNEEFWGVTTATPVQRAKCRLIEGRPVGDLATHSDVVEMCNGPAPNLTERPGELLDISAIRIGKSLWAGCALFWMSQTVDLSNTRESDIVNIFVVALKLQGCAAIIKHLVTPLIEKPALRGFLADSIGEVSVKSALSSGLRIKRPHDGRIIEVKCIPLDKGGGSAVSVFCAGLAVDEYPRMAGAEDGVRNVEHFRDAVQGRMLPGAVGIYTGSPWQPYGPAYDNTVKHFGKPLRAPDGAVDLLVLRTSAKSFVGIPGSEWTQKKVDKLKRVNQTAYKTDFLAEFADGEEAVFPAQAIDDAVRLPRPDLDRLIIGRPAIFADPSALRHDFWACMVGAWAYPAPQPEDEYEVEVHDRLDEFDPNNRGQIIPGADGKWVRILENPFGGYIKCKVAKVQRPFFKVFEIKSWAPAVEGAPAPQSMRGLDLVRAVGELARKYDCEDFHWDGYEQLMLGDLIRREGLRPVVHTWSGANRKTHAVDHLRTLFVERRVQLPTMPPNHDDTPTPAERLKTELQRFRSRPTPGGNFQYVVAGGAGHGDHASCLTLAMRVDLDGFLDRSPTAMPAERHEQFDNEEDNYYARAA